MKVPFTFSSPEVTDEDILWASHLLGLPENAFYGEEGTDPRQAVLKSKGTMDVAACPGSGKTTLLVAKLAILAEKWRCRTRGICVLSHTNAARREIESSLGNTTTGRRLLSYPHFIGTIHAFVNEFLSLPWLRSQEYPITMIDTDISLRRRWNDLPYETRKGLEKNYHGSSVLTVRSPDFGVGNVRWGRNGVLGTDTPTYSKLREVCRKSCLEGYFCYDEMFMWANDMMDKVADTVGSIRSRFPLLFIDETQDNNRDQTEILWRIFMEGSNPAIRQRFGDANQAIFDFTGADEATEDEFPSVGNKDLPNSYRFGQKIANLADPLGIKPYDLKGYGPKAELQSCQEEEQHTIFLFDDDSTDKVLPAYAELLINTFSDYELRNGVFKAIGQVHKDKAQDHEPRHIGHYWSDYDPELSHQDPKPQTFVQYVMGGMGKAQAAGEAYPAVEKIATGILRLVGMTEGRRTSLRYKYCHRHVLRLLEESRVAKDGYMDLLTGFAVRQQGLTKDTWNNKWSGVVRKVVETITGIPLCSQGTEDFLKWRDELDHHARHAVIPRYRDNVFRYYKDGKEVAIRIGSVHSVKGETHTATLVLETFWYDHNLDKLKQWITGDRKGWKQQDGVRQRDRLKVHYVAMTRPTHLLCLAMKRSSFETEPGTLDNDAIEALRQRGWQIKLVCRDELSEPSHHDTRAMGGVRT